MSDPNASKIIQDFRSELTKEQNAAIDLRANAKGKDGKRLYSQQELDASPDEYLAFFSDAIAKNEIKFEENIFTKIGDILVPILRKVGFAKIKFNTGKDVYNFMREYNKSIKSGVLSEAIAKAVPVDTSVSETKISPQSKTAPRATVLEAINNLVPVDVTTKQEFQNPRVFEPIYYSVIKEGGAINNYIKSRTTSKQETEKAIESVSDRLINFDPEALRKEGKAVGTEAFGEFIFANTNFGKLDAKKDLFKESEKAKQEVPLDAPEATTQLADEVSVDETKVKSTTSKLRNKLLIKQGDKIYNLAKKVSSEILKKDLPDEKLVAFINKKARESGLKKEIYKIVGKEKAIDESFINNYLNPKNPSQYILKDFSQRDLVKLEREVKDKIFFKQLPRLTKQAEILKAIEQGKLPKNQSLTSGAFVYEKLPTPTLEQIKKFFTQKRKAGLVNVITEMLVKDAAPEVTKGKMEPAKRAKVLSDLDREPTLKFSKSHIDNASKRLQKVLGVDEKVLSPKNKNDRNYFSDALANTWSQFLPVEIMKAAGFASVNATDIDKVIARGQFFTGNNFKVTTENYKENEREFTDRERKIVTAAVREQRVYSNKKRLFYRLETLIPQNINNMLKIILMELNIYFFNYKK